VLLFFFSRPSIPILFPQESLEVWELVWFPLLGFLIPLFLLGSLGFGKHRGIMVGKFQAGGAPRVSRLGNVPGESLAWSGGFGAPSLGCLPLQEPHGPQRLGVWIRWYPGKMEDEVLEDFVSFA